MLKGDAYLPQAAEARTFLLCSNRDSDQADSRRR